MKTTCINLHPHPNRRAEFWSESDNGPDLVFTYKDVNATINTLIETRLKQPNFCVYICSEPAPVPEIIP